MPLSMFFLSVFVRIKVSIHAPVMISLVSLGIYFLYLLQYKIPEYRDRAAERRALHGAFGVGPGQKNSGVDDYDTESSHPVCSEEEGAAEALNNSFGAGSYARRIIESMGWKEGEGLGNTRKGLTEPLKAIGNKGCAGLGWDANRSNKF